MPLQGSHRLRWKKIMSNQSSSLASKPGYSFRFTWEELHAAPSVGAQKRKKRKVYWTKPKS